MKKLILAVVVSSILAGCASSPESDIAARLDAMEQQQRDLIARQKAEAQEQREKEMAATPTWFLEPPKPDTTGFYGVGYMKSKHMGHALKGARLNAEADLAKQYKQELSGSERSFEQGNGDGDVSLQTTFLIDNIIDSVPVIGYTVVEQKMVPIDGVYETFVLLKLPYDQFNQVLQSQRSKEFDKTVQSHFDDLERRLKARRAEKAAIEQQQFNNEQEALKTRADIVTTESAPVQPVQPAKPGKVDQPVQPDSSALPTPMGQPAAFIPKTPVGAIAGAALQMLPEVDTQ